MKLSVVVPVYNVQDYLARCLDSVLSQVSDEYEMLLIDDGSSDQSARICDEYAARYAQVTAFHQENGGLSSARNRGIEKSRGEYVMFLDSDDWIENGAISRFCGVIDRYAPDLILGKAYLTDGNGRKESKINYYIPEGLYDIREYLNKLKEKMEFSPCAPFMVYKKSFLDEHQLRFKAGILHEDILWTLTALTHAENIYCMDDYFYFNYIRQGSITHSGNHERSGRDIVTVCSELREQFKSVPNDMPIEALRDIVARKYLEATAMLGRPVKGDCRMSGRELMDYSFFARTRKKAMLYRFSPRLYIFLAKHMQ